MGCLVGFEQFKDDVRFMFSGGSGGRSGAYQPVGTDGDETRGMMRQGPEQVEMSER